MREVKGPLFEILLNAVPFVPPGLLGLHVALPGEHPGNPSRKSEKLLKLNDPTASPGNSQFHRSRSISPPNRIVCLPLVQETWSAASHWVIVLKVGGPAPLIPTANNPLTRI